MMEIIYFILRHPLFLLIMATVLTTIIVPKISYRLKLKETRLKKALEIIEQSTEVNRRLNALLTTLEMFHKDNSGVAARLSDYKEEQKKLREIMMERYLEFDKVAWYWYSNVYTEAHLLGFVSVKELHIIGELVYRYEAKLIESTHSLDNLWNIFLREEYTPSDIQNTEVMKTTRHDLAKLERSRTILISELADILTRRGTSLPNLALPSMRKVPKPALGAERVNTTEKTIQPSSSEHTSKLIDNKSSL